MYNIPPGYDRLIDQMYNDYTDHFEDIEPAEVEERERPER